MLENLKTLIRNIIEYEQYTLSYHRLKLKFPTNPRHGVCQACGRKGFTNIHHWRYAFSYSEIRRNPRLALKFTTETCYPCHEIGNALRKIFECDSEMTIKTTSNTIRRLLILRKKALNGKG